MHQYWMVLTTQGEIDSVDSILETLCLYKNLEDVGLHSDPSPLPLPCRNFLLTLGQGEDAFRASAPLLNSLAIE